MSQSEWGPLLFHLGELIELATERDGVSISAVDVRRLDSGPRNGTGHAEPMLGFEQGIDRFLHGRYSGPRSGMGQAEPMMGWWIKNESLESQIVAEQATNPVRQPHDRLQDVTRGPEKGKFTPTGVLGLSLDEKQHRVRREGYEEVLNFAGKNLPWALFMVLIANPEGPHSKEALRTVWEEHGRTPDPELKSVVSEVKKLARRLRSLGLAIPSATLMGYRLVDAPNGKAR